MQFNARPHDLGHIGIHDDKQAAWEISELLSKVHDNLAYMVNKTEARRSVIVKRWMNRFNDRKCETLLLKAKPDLYPRKYAVPDFVNGVVCISATSSKFQYYLKLPREKICLTPCLDLPSLVEDESKLPSLIHHRAASPPSEWILFDWQQAKTLALHGGCGELTIHTVWCYVDMTLESSCNGAR